MIDAIIDISHYQTAVDFGAVRDSGIVGVILKSSPGSSFIDPTFGPRVTAARDAGLLVGAHHFCDSAPPSLQVANFLRAIARKGIGLS